MNIYYQWVPGAYSHIASEMAQIRCSLDGAEIVGLNNFRDVREHIDDESIGVLPIENSYAGSIHENLYGFLRYDYQIIGEIYLPIEHCLVSKEKDLSKIKKAYSHPQALSQCYDYLKGKDIESITYADTARAAKYIADQEENDIAAICSERAAQLAWLSILQKWIQDQKGNTTRFLIVTTKTTKITCIPEKQKNNKMTILFQARHIPASLYKCLGAFATNEINLTKIESLPSQGDPFNYSFRLDFEGEKESPRVRNALEELQFFTTSVRILWR